MLGGICSKLVAFFFIMIQWFQKHKKKAMTEALEKIKDGLFLFLSFSVPYPNPLSSEFLIMFI